MTLSILGFYTLHLWKELARVHHTGLGMYQGILGCTPMQTQCRRCSKRNWNPEGNASKITLYPGLHVERSSGVGI